MEEETEAERQGAGVWPPAVGFSSGFWDWLARDLE